MTYVVAHFTHEARSSKRLNFRRVFASKVVSRSLQFLTRGAFCYHTSVLCQNV